MLSEGSVRSRIQTPGIPIRSSGMVEDSRKTLITTISGAIVSIRPRPYLELYRNFHTDALGEASVNGTKTVTKALWGSLLRLLEPLADL